MARAYAKHIPPRKLRFAKESSTQYWHNGCAATTYHFNALSLLTPIFENMVIASIRQVHRQIQCPSLKLEVNSLIMQEANHSSEFLRFNQSYIAQFYPDLKIGGRLKWFRAVINRMSKSYQLAASAFGEHLATVASEFLLEDPRWLEGVETDIANMWRWHSIEEIEHKHVAFDVYQNICGKYWTRASTMFIFLFLFLAQYFALLDAMIQRDKKSRILVYAKLFKRYWWKPGFFRRFVWPFISYLAPNFHPCKRDNLALSLRWKTMLHQYQQS